LHLFINMPWRRPHKPMAGDAIRGKCCPDFSLM
jgi:hypothetical protein